MTATFNKIKMPGSGDEASLVYWGLGTRLVWCTGDEAGLVYWGPGTMLV